MSHKRNKPSQPSTKDQRIAELEAERPMMAAAMAPMAAKADYFATETMARGRSPEGKAVRGPKS